MPRWIIIVIIVVVAAAFRLPGLETAPPGLYPDEAMNGNNAIQALEAEPAAGGGLKVFYPENNGREGLFINLQALSITLFGKHIWSLRIVSAMAGVLTVLGLYLLAKQLFNWKIAAISSYLMAISFWHVNFSRIGFRAIMAPLFLVWGFYFFWQGKSSGRFRPFLLSGIFWGLGMYTYIAFRVMPLALILVVWAFIFALKKHFDHPKYEPRTFVAQGASHQENNSTTKMRGEQTYYLVLRGFALTMLVAIFVTLPILIYYYVHPADFLGRTGQLSVFASDNPFRAMGKNFLQTLGMFNFAGDCNWRHNYNCQPILLWPVGAFFALGFIKSIFRFFKQKKQHGHFSTVHTLLLSWFFVGLLPTIISNEGLPHALRAIVVAPVVFIFAGEGLWWLIDKLDDWYRAYDVHDINLLRGHRVKESSLIATAALLAMLGAFTIAEYDKYFNKWAKDPLTAAHFNQNYVEIGKWLNNMPLAQRKYVLVNVGGVLVNGIPMPAQTAMYVTGTYTPEKQTAKNIYYLTEEQYRRGQYDPRGIVIPLEK